MLLQSIVPKGLISSPWEECTVDWHRLDIKSLNTYVNTANEPMGTFDNNVTVNLPFFQTPLHHLVTLGPSTFYCTKPQREEIFANFVSFGHYCESLFLEIFCTYSFAKVNSHKKNLDFQLSWKNISRFLFKYLPPQVLKLGAKSDFMYIMKMLLIRIVLHNIPPFILHNPGKCGSLVGCWEPLTEFIICS